MKGFGGLGFWEIGKLGDWGLEGFGGIENWGTGLEKCPTGIFEYNACFHASKNRGDDFKKQGNSNLFANFVNALLFSFSDILKKSF